MRLILEVLVKIEIFFFVFLKLQSNALDIIYTEKVLCKKYPSYSHSLFAHQFINHLIYLFFLFEQKNEPVIFNNQTNDVSYDLLQRNSSVANVTNVEHRNDIMVRQTHDQLWFLSEKKFGEEHHIGQSNQEWTK